MATEFKKLSEVTLLDTAADNTTVLVEDGGEIKRVPKKEVGGAGGYVIKLKNSYLNDAGEYQMDESYDELYDVLMAGGSVWVDYTNAPEASAPASTLLGVASGSQAATNWGAHHVPIAVWCITDVGLVLVDFMSFMNDGTPIFYPNGSHNLDPVESQPE
jgi:hypothetical protein